jgi:hypothetical protein
MPGGTNSQKAEDLGFEFIMKVSVLERMHGSENRF